MSVTWECWEFLTASVNSSYSSLVEQLENGLGGNSGDEVTLREVAVSVTGVVALARPRVERLIDADPLLDGCFVA